MKYAENEQIIFEEDETYRAFVEKFKHKKTTDDCYTPENIYEAILEWASKEYHFDKDSAVRPFWPGGNYEAADYPDGCVVVDNPPFSILVKICRFYQEHSVPFFLFAPSLTCILNVPGVCAIAAGAIITYDNGAVVNTGFVTNMDKKYCLRTAADLHDILLTINKENTHKDKKELPKYEYPMNVIHAARMQYYSAHHTDYFVRWEDAVRITALDSMKAQKKSIFGGGLLLSDRAAAERTAAERAAAERAAAIPSASAPTSAAEIWALSDREKLIIEHLGGNND